MRSAARLVATSFVALAIAACTAFSAGTPSDAVRRVVAASLAHDPRGAAPHVCLERRGDGEPPVVIEGITEAVDGLTFEEGFALIAFDPTGLAFTDHAVDDDLAEVSVTGTLVETIDPSRFEAAYRAGVVARGEAVDQAFLDQKLAMIGTGRHELPVDHTVRVVRRDGAWQACELLPTESMPSPASIRLTSDPETPASPVEVRFTSRTDPDFHRDHTFEAGTPLRGSFPTSSGGYSLIGLGGKCRIDLLVGPEREADVVIRLHDDTCTFEQTGEHGPGGVVHEDDAVLIE